MLRVKLEKSLPYILVFLIPFSGSGSAIAPLFYAVFVSGSLLGLLKILVSIRSTVTSGVIFALSFFLIAQALILLIRNVTFSLQEQMVVCLSLFCLPIYIHIGKDPEYLTSFAKYMLFMGGGHTLFAIHQLYFGYDLIWGNPVASGRPSGVFSWGAPVVGSFVAVALTFYYSLPKDQKKLNSVRFLFALCFLGLIISGSRSFLLIHFLFIILALTINSNIKSFVKIIVPVMVVSFWAITNWDTIIDWTSPYLSQNQIYRLSSIGVNLIEEQSSKRIATWVQTACMIIDRPTMGYGFGGFESNLFDYLYCAPNSEGIMPHPHMLLLELLASLGLIAGCLVLLIIWLSILTRNIRENLFSVFVAVGFFSPLNVAHGLVSLWWLVLLLILLGLAIGAKSNAVKTSENPS